MISTELKLKFAKGKRSMNILQKIIHIIRPRPAVEPEPPKDEYQRKIEYIASLVEKRRRERVLSQGSQIIEQERS